MAAKVFKPVPPATFYLNPFGPFNTFTANVGSLYVESGAVSLQYSGYANISSYFPEQLFTNKILCPLSGYLRLNCTKEEGLDKCPETKTTSVSGNNDIKGEKGFSESIAFGCEKKVDKIECMNPNGNSYTLYRHVIAPKTIINMPFLPIVPSAGGQIAVGQAYLEWRNNWLKSQITQSYVRGYGFNSSPFASKSEKADICGCELIDKKYQLKRYVHPQSFSGKTRLLVQTIFGCKNKLMDVKVSPDGSVSVMYTGLAPPKSEEYPGRVASLDNGFTKLHTDDAGNYYLLQISSSISVNALVPSREGRLLQKWLKTKNFDKKKSAVYEAYILSSCSPTKTINIAGSTLEGVWYQSLGGYGWKSNWKGNEFSIATLDWETPCKAQLFTANVTLVDPVALYADEKDRKLKSLTDQFEAIEAKKTMTKEQLAELVPSVENHYTVVNRFFVTETPAPDPEDPPIKKYCVDGDIEEGVWTWSIVNEENADTAKKKTLKEELKTKNKQNGNLPYSPTFFKDLADAFIVSESLADSGEFKLPYGTDRIFTWDEKYGVYNLELPYDVRDHIGGIPGSGPVYCFYSDKDLLKTVYYQNGPSDGTTTNDNDNSPSECGDSFSRGSTISGGGNTSNSSFYVGGTEVVAPSSSGYSQSESSTKQSCMGSNLECLGYPPHPGPCNVVYCGTYFTKNIRGSLEGKSFSFSGGQSSRIALVIPKYDCEAVFIASVTTYSGSHSEYQYNGDKCVCAQWVSPRRSAGYWQPCFSAIKGCGPSTELCCSQEKQFAPIHDQNYGPGQACADLGPTMAANGGIFVFDVYGFYFDGPATDALMASYRGHPGPGSGRCTYRPTGPECIGEELQLIPQGIHFAYLGCNYNYDSDCTITYKSKSANKSSSVLKVYAVTRTTESTVLEGTEGYGDLANMFSGDVNAGNDVYAPGCSEWTGYQKFLGHIDPKFPYVESNVDIHQSCLGAYWLASPNMVYSEDYPFDKQGLYYIGAC